MEIRAYRERPSLARPARKRMEHLQQSGEGAWEDLKAGVELAWDAMGEAMESATSRFKK